MLRARKKFGQHFLADRNVIRRILDRAGLTSLDRVLEIGPGRGALTLPLAGRVASVLAVEKDRDLAAFLQESLASRGVENVTLVTKDILTFDFTSLEPGFDGKWLAIGNLPYNISTPVLERLIEHRRLFRGAVLMFQKEVADRLTAQAGSRTYGALSVLVRYHAEVSRLLRVGRECFRPSPRVDSTVVKLDFERPFPERAEDEVWFRNVVRAAFAHRRKTLQNALLTSFPDRTRTEVIQALRDGEIDPGSRAETLGIEDFLRLSRVLPR
ncbi:MAG: 16S rRNA (adenine(1518)-N(6)/adenine(1519)-N(6))-dimethyltransferase RsmA [Desulfobacteraceae bacterium]|jgi:16S rRNA (adenine1518-N6/adenine1519-N6)-dimethyltransferase